MLLITLNRCIAKMKVKVQMVPVWSSDHVPLLNMRLRVDSRVAAAFTNPLFVKSQETQNVNTRPAARTQLAASPARPKKASQWRQHWSGCRPLNVSLKRRPLECQRDPLGTDVTAGEVIPEAQWGGRKTVGCIPLPLGRPPVKIHSGLVAEGRIEQRLPLKGWRVSVECSAKNLQAASIHLYSFLGLWCSTSTLSFCSK